MNDVHHHMLVAAINASACSAGWLASGNPRRRRDTLAAASHRLLALPQEAGPPTRFRDRSARIPTRIDAIFYETSSLLDAHSTHPSAEVDRCDGHAPATALRRAGTHRTDRRRPGTR